MSKSLQQLFSQELIFFNQKFASKEAALQFLAKALVNNHYAKNANLVYQKFWKREQEGSTGVGEAIAMPHLRDNVMQKSVVAFMQVQNLDWQAIDGQPVKYIFAIAMDESSGNESHLTVIATLSKLLIDDQFKAELTQVTSPTAFLNLINAWEQKLLAAETESDTPIAYDVLAVTACPTGIAHTFHAAESLKKTAASMDVKIKVETQGSDGQKNTLSESDIKQAKGVILAVDRAVETYRFKDHINVIETSTKKAIHNAKELINDALHQKGKRLKSITGGPTSFDGSGELGFADFHKKAYKAILNGVSYMLPFVIFGGIMIALSFLIDIGNAQTAGGNFGKSNGWAWWFNSIGGSTFGYVVPILSAYITFAMAGKMGLLPGFLVGIISTNSDLYTNQFVSFFKLEQGGSQSGFFGGIGGAFLAAAVIIVFSRYLLNWMPKKLMGIKNILVIPFFGTLTVAVLFYWINIPFLYLNYGFNRFLAILEENPGLASLLGLVLGFMMGFDLGGPVNKAAYLFGAATLNSAEGITTPSSAMAAVMLAGMMPPLVIALSTILMPKYWSSEERESALGNWVFGLSFISEGAIPFTARRPKILVPVNVFSGAIAGVISTGLGVTLQAPHGGIFVFGLLGTNLPSLQHLSYSTKIGIGVGFAFISIITSLLASNLLLWILFKFVTPKKATDTPNKSLWKIFQAKIRLLFQRINSFQTQSMTVALQQLNHRKKVLQTWMHPLQHYANSKKSS